MTKEEATEIFLNRGYIEVDDGSIYNPDKWREACAVISDWLKQESLPRIEEDTSQIDTHISQLKKLKSFHNGSYGASINFAIGIMRDYQSIEEVMDNRPDDDANSNSNALSKIEMIIYGKYLKNIK